MIGLCINVGHPCSVPTILYTVTAVSRLVSHLLFILEKHNLDSGERPFHTNSKCKKKCHDRKCIISDILTGSILSGPYNTHRYLIF
jgi:hypothetical protein